MNRIAKKFLESCLIILIVALVAAPLGSSPRVTIITGGSNTGFCTYNFYPDAGSFTVRDGRFGNVTIGSDFATLINSVIASHGQGSYCLEEGVYPITTTINVPVTYDDLDNNGHSESWRFWGTGLSGNGYFTKTQGVPRGTVLYSATGFTKSIFFLGYNLQPSSNQGIDNVDIAYMTLSGMPLPYFTQTPQDLQMAPPTDQFQQNACISALDLENSRIHDIFFTNCSYGIYLNRHSGWTQDNNEIYDDWFAYNKVGFWDAGSQVITVHDIHGYLNYYNFIRVTGQFVNIYNIFSNADDWGGTFGCTNCLTGGVKNNTIWIISTGMVRMRNVYLAQGAGLFRTGNLGIQIQLDFQNATVMLSDVTITGLLGSCINVFDDFIKGTVYLYRVTCGYSPDFIGGIISTVFGYGVKAAVLRSSNIQVFVQDSDFTGSIFGSLYGNFTLIQNVKSEATQTFGSATVNNGATSVTVTHGLGTVGAVSGSYGGRLLTPNFVFVTPTSNSTLTHWVDTLTTTTFKINTRSAVSGAQTFYWQAIWDARLQQIGP